MGVKGTASMSEQLNPHDFYPPDGHSHLWKAILQKCPLKEDWGSITKVHLWPGVVKDIWVQPSRVLV